MCCCRAQIASAIGMGNIARRTIAKPGIESTKLRTSRWSALKCCRRNGNRHCSQSRMINRQASSGLPTESIAGIFAMLERSDSNCRPDKSGSSTLLPKVPMPYAPMRRNSKVVSGLTTSPFISSNGYTRKLIGPLSGSGSTTRSRPLVSSNRLAGL